MVFRRRSPGRRWLTGGLVMRTAFSSSQRRASRLRWRTSGGARIRYCSRRRRRRTAAVAALSLGGALHRPAWGFEILDSLFMIIEDLLLVIVPALQGEQDRVH